MADIVGCAQFNALVEKVEKLDGSETKVTQGENVKVTGTGKVGAPYVISGLYPEMDVQIDKDSPVAIAGYREKLDPLTGEIEISSSGRKLYVPVYSDDSVIQLTDVVVRVNLTTPVPGAPPVYTITKIEIKKTSTGNPFPAAGNVLNLKVDGVDQPQTEFVLESVLYGFFLLESITYSATAVPIEFTDSVGNKYAATGVIVVSP